MPDSQEDSWLQLRRCSPDNVPAAHRDLLSARTSPNPAEQQLFCDMLCARCPVAKDCLDSQVGRGIANQQGAAGGLTEWRRREYMRTGEVPRRRVQRNPERLDEARLLQLMQPF